MKQIIARISLAVAIALFFLGLFVMCFCPSWYLITALFAGIAVWLGAPKIRAWSVACLIASLIFAIVNAQEKTREREKINEVLHRIEEKQSQETNQLQHPDITPKSTNMSNSLTN